MVTTLRTLTTEKAPAAALATPESALRHFRASVSARLGRVRTGVVVFTRKVVEGKFFRFSSQARHVEDAAASVAVEGGVLQLRKVKQYLSRPVSR